MQVAIVGGGLVGVALAVLLRERGAEVSVLERDRLGAHASSAAGGILGAQTETDGDELAGQGFAARVHARERTLAWVAELEDGGYGSVDLSRHGVVRVAFEQDEADKLAALAQAQHLAGARAELLDGADLRARIPAANPRIVRALHLLDDAHLDPVAYLQAAVRRAQALGVQLRERTEVRAIATDGGGVQITTEHDRLTFDRVIVAAGSWSSLLCPQQTWDIRPIRGQMLDLKLEARAFGPILYGGGAYAIPRADGRVTVGATMEDVGHQAGTHEDDLAKLQRAAERSAPILRSAARLRSWSGFRPFSPHGLLIRAGSIAGTYVLGGHHRNGILLARASAERMAALLEI